MENLARKDLAHQKYSNRKIRFAFQGLIYALLSGATCALYSIVGGELSAHPALAVGTTAAVVMIASLVVAGLQDFFVGVWTLAFNLPRGRSLKEYIRHIKTRKLAFMLSMAGLFGGPIGLGALMIGINLAGPTYALIVSSTSPIVAAILGRALYKEKLGLRVVAGMIIALIGVSIAGWAPPEGQYPYFVLGLFISAISSIGWGLEGAAATYASDMTDPNLAVGIFRSFFAGLICLVIFVPIFGLASANGLIGWEMVGNVLTDPRGIFLVLLIGLLAAFSYLTAYWAFSKAGAVRSLVLINTFAIWSIIFGLILRQFGVIEYSITTLAIVGAFIDFVGITLVAGNPKDLLKLRDV